MLESWRAHTRAGSCTGTPGGISMRRSRRHKLALEPDDVAPAACNGIRRLCGCGVLQAASAFGVCTLQTKMQYCEWRDLGMALCWRG